MTDEQRIAHMEASHWATNVTPPQVYPAKPLPKSQLCGAMMSAAEELATAVEIAVRGGRVHEFDVDSLRQKARSLRQAIATYEGAE